MSKDAERIQRELEELEERKRKERAPQVREYLYLRESHLRHQLHALCLRQAQVELDEVSH